MEAGKESEAPAAGQAPEPREAAKEGAAVPMFRKKGNRGNIRKREEDEDAGEVS